MKPSLVTLALVAPIFIFSPQIATLLLGDKAEVIAQTVSNCLSPPMSVSVVVTMIAGLSSGIVT